MVAPRSTYSNARNGTAGRTAVLCAVILAVVSVPSFGTNTPARAGSFQDHAEVARPWPGPDGPLPFRTHDEANDFLRNARVVSSEDFGVGITGLKRLVLERDGVSARGAFHEVDKVSRDARANGRTFRQFFDSYKNQCAAYELARLFELESVPPTVCRRVNGIAGSVQLWVEGTRTEAERQEAALRPPVVLDWLRQMQAMRLFDTLMFNDDRNPGNYLSDDDWKLWLIDHSRAFQMRSDLRYVDGFVWCAPRMWELLQQVTDDQIRAAVDSYLVPQQIGGLLARRTLLVEHLQKMIDERGKDAVIR